MTTTIYPKNISDRKKMFMDKKFGLFKSLVLRAMQYKLFLKQKNKLFHLAITCWNWINLYKYYYTTQDIWNRIYLVVYLIKRDIRNSIIGDPNVAKYLPIFGLCCPYVKDCNTCLEYVNRSKFLHNNSYEEISKFFKIHNNRIELNCSLCPLHKKDEIKRKSIIKDSLYNFPVELCNIIFKYSLPYSFKL